MTDREKSPAFQFYPKDFLTSSKVMKMTATERGIYITLLCVAWLEGGLPDDVGQLAALAKMPVKQFARIWPHNLQGCFALVRNGQLVNERLEEERVKQATRRQRLSDNGKKGGRPKKPRSKPKGLVLVSGEKPDGNQKKRLSSSSSSSNTSDPSDQRAHPVKAFLTHYEECFVRLIGERPVIYDGRDARIAKTTIDKVGEEKAHALLVAFFESSDDFIRKSGYGLNVFAGQLNKLITDGATALRTDQYGHYPPCKNWEECRDRVLEEARAAREAANS